MRTRSKESYDEQVALYQAISNMLSRHDGCFAWWFWCGWVGLPTATQTTTEQPSFDFKEHLEGRKAAN